MTGRFGGGELLRAVLDASSIKKTPYFYCVELTGSDGFGTNFTTKNTVLQLKSGAYFLQTSIWGLSSNTSVDQPEFINLFDAGNQQAFINAASVFQGSAGNTFANPNTAYVGLINDSLASCVTLPEYILWGPNSLVGVSWMGRNALDLFQHYRYLILGGIEYKMKDS